MDHTSRLVNKAALSAANAAPPVLPTPGGGGYSSTGFGYITDWVDVHAYPFVSFIATFTNGAAAGTLSLQQSNAVAFTGGSPVTPLFVKDSASISDIADVPAGSGQNVITVAGAQAYALNQWLVAYRWVRLVYTPSSNVNVTLDVTFHVKTGG